MAFSPIDKLKRWWIDIRVIVVVVRHLSQGKVGSPNPTEIDHTGSQHNLEHLNVPLALAISMRMIISAKVQPRIQLLVESVPKLQREPNVLI